MSGNHTGHAVVQAINNSITCNDIFFMPTPDHAVKMVVTKLPYNKYKPIGGCVIINGGIKVF